MAIADPLSTSALSSEPPPRPARTKVPTKRTGKPPGNGARSMVALRKLGYTVGMVERWNGHVGIRQDLFGFVDIVAVKPGMVMFVQTTSDAQVRAHIEKLMRHENFKAVESSGARLVIHGWSKIANRWSCREVVLAAGWLPGQ